VITEFAGTPGGLTFITAGPDGALWYTVDGTNKIGRITTGGGISEFSVNNQPGVITTGPDGALWFTVRDGNRIARFPAGSFAIAVYRPPPESG
jgi:virginiamycin B lyase